MISAVYAFLTGLIAEAVYIAAALLLKVKLKRVIITALFIAYLTAVAAVTLFPVPVDEKVEYYGEVTWYNFVPFRTIAGQLGSGFNTTAAVQIIGNVLLAVPFGVFVRILIVRQTPVKLLLLAAAFPAAVELAQLLTGLALNNMYRNVDIDDFILNLAGVCLGYALYLILPEKIKRI